MPNTVNVTVLLAGPRNLVVHVFLQSDGLEGDLQGYPIISPTDLGYTALQVQSARFELRRIDYNFSGFDAIVEFNQGTPTPNFKWVLTEGANAPVDFNHIGGIKDDSGQDGTGALELTTSGFSNSSDCGSILFSLRMPEQEAQK